MSNEHCGVSNHQQFDCLFNRSFRLTEDSFTDLWNRNIVAWLHYGNKSFQDIFARWVWIETSCNLGNNTAISSLSIGRQLNIWITVPYNKVHGANMGPIWGRQEPGGPHVGSMNFAIWGVTKIGNTCKKASEDGNKAKKYTGSYFTVVKVSLVTSKKTSNPCVTVRGIHQ